MTIGNVWVPQTCSFEHLPSLAMILVTQNTEIEAVEHQLYFILNAHALGYAADGHFCGFRDHRRVPEVSGCL